MSARECQFCEWWKAFMKDGNATGRGDCHRYPPMTAMGVWSESDGYGCPQVVESRADDYWPTTDADEYCGEWMVRP